MQSDKERMHNGNEVYSSDGICGCLSATDYKRPKIVADPKIIRVGKIEGTFDSISRVYSPEGISPTLDTCQGGGRQVKVAIPVISPDREKVRQRGRRLKTDGEPMFTLTAQDRHGIYDGDRVRRLTPREYWRLQGFPDWAYEKVRPFTSDSQLYKQAGNSVTVPVIEAIARKLADLEIYA